MSPPQITAVQQGRIRQEQGGIAWGDLRNCLNQIVIEPSTASALFEYRFTGEGELSGHNLGNLMLKALEDMHIRPIEAINLIRELLKVKSHIIPMSEEPVHLAASLGSGSSIVGEVSIDNLTELPQSLFLVPMVKQHKKHPSIGASGSHFTWARKFHDEYYATIIIT